MNLLDAITQVADDLTEPHQHREPYHVWTGSRNKQIRHHITTMPGLLAQLRDSITPVGGIGQGHSVPNSRPPLALEAVSRYLVISNGVNRWTWSLKLQWRGTVESSIRQLVGHAPSLDPDVARQLLAEMREWRRWCCVYTGWERLYRPANVPCPVCAALNTLRINLTNKTAACTACRAGWSEDDGSIYVLGDHIKVASERATLTC